MSNMLLTRMAHGISLPFAALPNLACASVGDQLHLLALAASAPRMVMHLRLNSDGRPDGEASTLPLSEVGGVTTCGAELVATGQTNGEPIVIGLDSEGAIRWQSAIPHTPSPPSHSGTPAGRLIGLQPLCLDGQGALVWATAGDTAGAQTNQPSLWLATITNGRCDPPQRIAAASPSGELALTTVGNGVAILQKWHDPSRLELIARTDGQTQHQAVDSGDNPSAPAIAFLDNHFVLLWIAANAGEIRMQAFDRRLTPIAPSSIIQRFDRPARPRSVRLIVGAAEHSARAAVVTSFATPTLGPAVSHGRDTPTSRAPSLEIAGYVAAYDRSDGTLGPWQPLTDPPVSYQAAGWAGARLIVIGGGAGARLSVFN